ncbi:P-II family nitrogen regulator [Magnetofaba australis]|uniref:Putative nitrogen regulatory protein P-II family proteins-like protein n=1 Tax=Magnetofaba australis IT-1 TaxID=1434232 RepID=A0A1Y2JZL7_9PROT|nr:P-II family nitrogen regulator [Magnetofaba australis]OSM00348.1 putative nitrogen regulatory protein P-II family proteins-like protein [Magnetofaba australis IT-1]
MKFKVIVVTSRTDLTDRIVDAAKAAGATGATIINGRGAGIHEARTFFGLTLDVQRDVILMLLEQHLVEPVLAAASEAGEFAKPGTGIAFVLDVESVAGLQSQIPKFQETLQKAE